ncbi:hypothetical protein Fmac_006029 [Flemingia macrophylla]|uniref:H15 domain-containing protein n=1 Tax=Flemingia macrophylla TaxID=520843 RepID=A0ABD1N9K3_9FABA
MENVSTTATSTSPIMSHLRDSLIAQLTELHPSFTIHPHHATIIQCRLQSLLPNLHTPTHPPYALMIRNAIMGLKEDAGSEEEAISAFILREYEDLPWAHAKILTLQLDKLCEIGELARAPCGRFALNGNDVGETKEQCKRGEKRKRVKRRGKNCSDAVGVHEESHEGQLQVIGQQSHHTAPEALSQPTTAENGLDAAADRKAGKCKQNANYQEKSLLPLIVIEQEPTEKNIDDRCLPQSQVRFLYRNVNCIDKIHPHDQTEDMVCSYSKEKETSFSSHPETPNSLVSPTHNSGQQLVVPTSTGSPEFMLSTGIKLSSTQLQQQITLDIDLGTVFKRKASLNCESVHDEQPMQCNQVSPKRNLDGKPMSIDFEKPPKRPRGRPPKLDRGTNQPIVSLLPLDDDIHNEQRQHLNGWGGGTVQFGLDLGRGRGRGLGKPPKLNQIIEQCEEQLPQARGRGRPPKLNGNPIQYEEQSQAHQKSRTRKHSRGPRRGRGRPPKLNENSIQYQEQSQQEDKVQQHGQDRDKGKTAKQHIVRGRGRPPKLNQTTSEQQLQPQDKAQVMMNSPSSGRSQCLRVQRRGRHHKSESREPKPPAEANRANWVLKVLPNRLTQK